MGPVLDSLGADLDRSTTVQDRSVGATTDAERTLAGLLAEVLRVDSVAVEGNFFEDLGADSLVMAHFCARVRKRGDLASVSMKDIYSHPTIRSLAASLVAPGAGSAKAAVKKPVIEKVAPASTLQYLRYGALQFLFYFGYVYVATAALVGAYSWISVGSTGAAIYARLVAAGLAGFLVVATFPILAKWLLIGRWKPGQIPLWSLAHFRFWIVKTLLRSNPCGLLFVGSPLYVLYLKALGAKIGPGAAIFSRRLPICTDLLTIGAGTVIRREAVFQCYRAHAGRIEMGAVTIGRDAFIGEMSVLDINTSMGDGTQLGHASALHNGQTIPGGERWHGSPAQRTELNYLRVPPAPCGTLRRIQFCVGTLLLIFLLYLPLSQGGLYLLFSFAPSLGEAIGLSAAAGAHGLTLRGAFMEALAVSLAVYSSSLIIGLPLVLTVPRLLNLFVKPDAVYPLYGFHDRVHRVIARMTTYKFFNYLFGDSSYIVHYLSWLGYRLHPVEQTGSNFGTDVKHNNPYLCTVGTGTMVADGLTFLNDDVSATSFRVSLASIGPRTFVGNNVMFPAGGRTGDNCLLATKVMVPLDGEMREGVGLLGSPSFQIPRTVDRDSRFDHLGEGEALRRGLSAKNRYNIRTMGMFLFARWLGLFVLMAFNLAAFSTYGAVPHVITAALVALSLPVGALYVVLVERCFTAFRPLKPTYCSIYDPAFWRYERVWKVPASHYMRAFDGTPFKNLLWRLMGVRVGRRVFDDGAYFSERTLTSIGDDCVLNVGSSILCHSQEDATFKSDHSSLGAGCTLGVGALVHYGVTMGDGAVLAADSFLMKGEEVPAYARWGGNPAREM